jgi:AraC-like DNA-binding protein
MNYDYVSLVKHLNTTFSTAYTMQAKESLTINNFSDVDHILLQVHSGQVSYEKSDKKETIYPGQVLFIASGEPIILAYGNVHQTSIKYAQSIGHPYLQCIKHLPTAGSPTSFSCIHFRTQAFKAFDLFHILHLSPMLLPPNDQIGMNIQKILSEQTHPDTAQGRILNLYTELLVIALLRYFNTQKELVENLLKKQHYFLEERLLGILQYIHANLRTDLSNSRLATISHTSEDYMGQYFKTLTGVSPQTYIEDQRLKEAMRLLRNTDERVYRISEQVGFRDTTYFCRRFKLKFGIQANKIRALTR